MTQEIPVEEAQQIELTIEQKRIRRRSLAQAAISLATQGRWDESLTVNQEILEMFPDDPEAYNRLGNAYSQLNRIDDSIQAYERALQSQPTNVIAQRNLTRLRRIAEAGEVAAKPSQKLQSSFFIEEVGKTGITNVTDLAPPETVLRVTAGDEVGVAEESGSLVVKMLDDTYLGKVESALADRLTRLMQGGNKYQAGVVMAEGNRLRILIREVHQSPEQEGRISFPPRTVPEVRAYTRETLIRRAEEDEDLEAESSDVEPEDVDEDDENPADFGFSETSLSGESEST